MASSPAVTGQLPRTRVCVGNSWAPSKSRGGSLSEGNVVSDNTPGEAVPRQCLAPGRNAHFTPRASSEPGPWPFRRRPEPRRPFAPPSTSPQLALGPGRHSLPHQREADLAQPFLSRTSRRGHPTTQRPSQLPAEVPPPRPDTR